METKQTYLRRQQAVVVAGAAPFGAASLLLVLLADTYRAHVLAWLLLWPCALAAFAYSHLTIQRIETSRANHPSMRGQQQ